MISNVLNSAFLQVGVTVTVNITKLCIKDLKTAAWSLPDLDLF